MTITTDFDHLLTPTTFRAWLETLPPETPVGVRAEPMSCPMACYLNAHGYPNACVESDWVSLDEETWEVWARPTPPWLVWFMDCVDDGEWNQTVTAAEALRHLGEAETETTDLCHLAHH